MMNLKEMTAKDVVRAAKEESGLTNKEIAERMDVSLSLIKRYMNKDDPYTPGLEMLPRLCAALGNTLPLDWAAAQLGLANTSRKEEMLSALSNVRNVLEEAEVLIRRTDTSSCWEEQGINAALDEAEGECERVRGFLSQGGRCGCGDKKKVWCPLWKFWKKCFRGIREDVRR